MSSLIFLGISVIVFIVVYGIMFLLLSAILGSFFSALDAPITDPAWVVIDDETQNLIRFLIPLAATIGIFMLILKVLMVSSVRGRD